MYFNDNHMTLPLLNYTYGSVSAGREKWPFNVLFFNSSTLACVEPQLELFEVWEINVQQIIIIANGINSQTALARVLDEPGPKRKQNLFRTVEFGHSRAPKKLKMRPTVLAKI